MFKSKTDIKKLSSLIDDSFFVDFLNLSENSVMVRYLNKVFIYLFLHNILEFCKVFVQVPFATNKTELDI